MDPHDTVGLIGSTTGHTGKRSGANLRKCPPLPQNRSRRSVCRPLPPLPLPLPPPLLSRPSTRPLPWHRLGSQRSRGAPRRHHLPCCSCRTIGTPYSADAACPCLPATPTRTRIGDTRGAVHLSAASARNTLIGQWTLDTGHWKPHQLRVFRWPGRFLAGFINECYLRSIDTRFLCGDGPTPALGAITRRWASFCPCKAHLASGVLREGSRPHLLSRWAQEGQGLLCRAACPPSASRGSLWLPSLLLLLRFFPRRLGLAATPGDQKVGGARSMS